MGKFNIIRKFIGVKHEFPIITKNEWMPIGRACINGFIADKLLKQVRIDIFPSKFRRIIEQIVT